MNNFYIQKLTFQLYLLQLENYHLSRFLKAALFNFFSSGKERRLTLEWTAKITLVFSIALILFIASIIGVGYGGVFFSGGGMGGGGALGLIALTVLPSFFFFYLGLAVVVLKPIDYLAKKMVIARAKKKLLKFP